MATGNESRFLKAPREDVRGKHTHSPGFEKGNHWVECDMCGCDVRYQDARMNWKGQLVCGDDWEPRHEQDFVRGYGDDNSVPEVRLPQEKEVTVTYAEAAEALPSPTFGEL